MNKLLQRATLAVAALTLSTGTAFAAAGDACKWNMGFSAGYAMTGKPTQTSSDAMKDTTGAMVGSETKSKLKGFHGLTTTLSVGYAMSDNVRFSLGIGYSPKLKQDNENSSVRNITGVATAYYDFVNDTMATPFVSLGLGMQSAKPKNVPSYIETIADPATATMGTPGVSGKILGPDGDVIHKKSTDFRGELGVGVGFKVSDGVHLELGYKLANAARFKAEQGHKLKDITAGTAANTASTSKDLKSETVTLRTGSTLEHSLSLGVRFNF